MQKMDYDWVEMEPDNDGEWVDYYEYKDLAGLARKAMEVIEDIMDEKPARHSLSELHARLKFVLGW